MRKKESLGNQLVDGGRLTGFYLSKQPKSTFYSLVMQCTLDGRAVGTVDAAVYLYYFLLRL